MTSDKIRAGRAIWAWRLFRRGELPARVEVLAAAKTSDADLSEARSAVREMADEDGTPIEWLGSEIVQATSDDEEVLAARVKEDALAHGMSEEELPLKLRD